MDRNLRLTKSQTNLVIGITSIELEEYFPLFFPSTRDRYKYADPRPSLNFYFARKMHELHELPQLAR